ncbi:Arylsulfotransferase-domain-containing protein [Xylariaceae sp. FL1651]|nr:Arylsulfotransferase-domain-containing protein [Xylariaceae sp. FL1651]
MFCGSLGLLLTVVGLHTPVWAHNVLSSAYLYEFGFYGLYPQTSFKSFELTSPLLNFPRWDEGKCGDGYYVIAPKGKIVSNSGPTILDSRGELIWTDNSYGVVFNLQIQTYRGEDYLTFWSNPEGSSHGYGRGIYYMLDSSYRLFRKFEPAGEGLKGDLHELQITEDGTVLMTIYSPVPANLTSIGGPEKGWALDCMVQEIDIETGILLFEWSAMEHVAVSDTLRYFAGEDDGTTPDTAFDYFHINSIDKDGEGNYVVSGRHTSTIMCISSEGDLLWTLGGVLNDFEDLSEGRATDFKYQHHAKVHANSTLSIFDNAGSERAGSESTHHYSRGLLVQLNVKNKTATLLQEYHNADKPKLTPSQGSMQVMEDRVVLGYGWLPFVTEFALDGSVICDVELAPWVAARWGLVNTYRAFKLRNWVGTPTDPPSVYTNPSEGQIFVSWNGATEVDRWVLQGAEWDDIRMDVDGFVDLDDVKKDAFEMCFDIEDNMPQYLRVAAVDGKGHVLMHSQVVDRHIGNASSSWVPIFLAGPCVFITLVITFLIIRKRGYRVIGGSSMRGLDVFAQVISVCRHRVLQILATSLSANPKEHHDRNTLTRWWRDWRGARTHELQSLYHD